MNKQPTTSKSGALLRFFKATFSAGLLTGIFLLLSGHTSQAGSATWKANPTSGDWNTPVNWTPDTVPNGPSDSAMFQSSTQTNVSLSANIGVNGIVFGAGASPFTIVASTTITLTISGTGITNNSGIAQNLVASGTNGTTGRGIIVFENNATVGNETIFTANGSDNFQGGGGSIEFIDTSSARNSSITNDGGLAISALGGNTLFFGTSTADKCTITNYGGLVKRSYGGYTQFFNSSTAGHATVTNNGGGVIGARGGVTGFDNTSTAGSATLIANDGIIGGVGGYIVFGGASSGGTARVKLFGAGFLTVNGHDLPGVTVGSIEGDGKIFLGTRNLSVGSNHLNTTFAGRISDPGTLTKIGTGKLVLTRSNAYTGGTTIERGKLIINNRDGTGTGSGPVQVNGGKLGGKGAIAGPVTVGTGTGAGAFLAPGYVHGNGSPGALTIRSNLTFNSGATYEVGVNSSAVKRDEVVALGVTINGGAQFAFADIGSAVLPAGTVFRIINNTAATPIAGTFSNLPDGSTFTSNGNTYQVNYKGGDGNDLTLTVVP